jgi:hypothetical protein
MSKKSEFEIKKDKALRLLAATDIRRSVYMPVILRLLWRLGVRVPPPHFVGFLVLALVSGAYFAVVYRLVIWFVDCIIRGRAQSIYPWVFTAIAAVIYGAFVSTYYDYGRRKYQLSSWSSLENGRDLSANEQGILNRFDGYQARMAAANDRFSEEEAAKDVADAIRDVRKQKK